MLDLARKSQATMTLLILWEIPAQNGKSLGKDGKKSFPTHLGHLNSDCKSNSCVNPV